MNSEQQHCEALANRIGSAHVNGRLLKGEELVQYLKLMPESDRISLENDLDALDGLKTSDAFMAECLEFARSLYKTGMPPKHY